MKRQLLISLIILLSVPASVLGRKAPVFRSNASCSPVFPIEESFGGHAMQAFSIFDGVLYAGYDSGLCRTYDFSTGRLIAEFPLGCNVRTNHCGNLNFSGPLLYVSGDLSEKACYVERVTPTSSSTVQTIRFRLDNDNGGSQAVIDTGRGRIVYMQRRYPAIGRQDNEFLIYEFRLPDVSEGDVVLTDAEVLRMYRLEKYFPIYQGASISGGRLYQSFGGPEDWASSEGTGFAVFDLSDGSLVRTVRVPLHQEPQSVQLYAGRTYMNFAGTGLCEIVPCSRKDMIVAAYVWPSCHDDSLAHRYLWSGGDGEWEVIRKGNPRFEGHRQPKEPLWGYEHDDDPEVVERWIRTALEYGVNTFIYDWYWYLGQPYLEGALNDGFLKAPSNGDMNFFIMWANHDVPYDYWNVHRYPDNKDILFSADFSQEDYRKIVDRIIGRYFTRPNYLKVDGRPVLAIYSYNNLVRSFGSVAKTAEGLDYFREQARKAGFRGIYLMDIRGECGRLTERRLADTRMRIDSLGVDGLAFYNMGGFDTDYLKHGRNAMRLRSDWNMAFPDTDLYPCVSIAWDDTPRFPSKGAKDVTRFNATPDNFRVFLGEAIDFALERGFQQPMVTINAWNEWVEGSYLLPDKEHGFGYLEAVSRAVRDSSATIDVMSFNIRNGRAKDGDNGWDKRKDDLAFFLESEQPDLIGLQEAHDFQLKHIMSSCPEYGSVGAGREDGREAGEQTAILWNRSRLSLEDWGFFWLSDTPDRPSLGWDAGYLRTATWALLRDNRSGKRFYAVNTHLDNKGAQAKEKGLELIMSRLSSINRESLPVVLTGDFNVREGDGLTAGLDLMMCNARHTASVTDSTASFNAWGNSSAAAAIDYIYYSGFTSCRIFMTMDSPVRGRKYISDHFPVRARLTF